ncbi:hypothetical protein M0804_010862 [Polistes exclamans]|nr:hypothetical protein M0804_010862 [Polistes exclamans]
MRLLYLEEIIGLLIESVRLKKRVHLIIGKRNASLRIEIVQHNVYASKKRKNTFTRCKIYDQAVTAPAATWFLFSIRQGGSGDGGGGGCGGSPVLLARLRLQNPHTPNATATPTPKPKPKPTPCAV